MSDFERGRAAIEALAEAVSSEIDLNESTTRLRIIDRLILDCLGWQPEDVNCEEHQQGDYLDYVLGSPQRQVVVEAKRSDLHFQIPAGVQQDRVISLKTFYDYSRQNREALNQVLNYSQRGGIPIAVLSNGHQLVAFLGSRQDGVAPQDGKALNFSSLAEMKADFSTLWSSLSRHGVASRSLHRKLSRGGGTSPPPEKLSARISNYPGFRNRTELETDVRILAEIFLLDLMQEEAVSEQFLRQCYCSSGALSQYALVSKEILRSRYSPVSDVASAKSARDRKGNSTQVVDDLISSALTRRPLILLGDVGVGKTIFLKYLFRVDAVDLLDNTVVFYIDFLRESSLIGDLRIFLVGEFERALDRTYLI
ncbi:hypothetical protein [Pseudofrankia sp. BMG5.37]|uniref:hypothetical protein n=1 Tax=Pseudofrankia sp. BMG5.37 TaxID=3050035 RepID=UPI002894B7D8|nr:hypothetical protein [Pseudofrankia sp. BMG5.37]MDT3443921.1 hypothetical protein [Pseudofrankia sp. BMG5.37]